MISFADSTPEVSDMRAMIWIQVAAAVVGGVTTLSDTGHYGLGFLDFSEKLTIVNLAFAMLFLLALLVLYFGWIVFLILWWRSKVSSAQAWWAFLAYGLALLGQIYAMLPMVSH